MNFSAQICPKVDLGLEIQKTDVGIKISILEILCAQVFWAKRTSFTFLAQTYPKIDFGIGILKI